MIDQVAGTTTLLAKFLNRPPKIAQNHAPRVTV